jgi:hypothetical protein
VGAIFRRRARDKAAAIEVFAAGRSTPQTRIVAPLIVSSEARPCSGGAYKVWEAFLTAKEGNGSGCALPHRPPCRRRRAVSPEEEGCRSGLPAAITRRVGTAHQRVTYLSPTPDSHRCPSPHKLSRPTAIKCKQALPTKESLTFQILAALRQLSCFLLAILALR